MPPWVSACAAAPEKTYPYGMTEKEWNELSIQDKAAIRRDFYFVEKGNMNFVNPDLKVEGKKKPCRHSGAHRPNRLPPTEKIPFGEFFLPAKKSFVARSLLTLADNGAK